MGIEMLTLFGWSIEQWAYVRSSYAEELIPDEATMQRLRDEWRTSRRVEPLSYRIEGYDYERDIESGREWVIELFLNLSHNKKYAMGFGE
jgi:hypothetical protein